MTNRSVQNLTPFVPSKDFALSSRFYRDLGFSETASIVKALRFERDGFGFWLQDYYVEDWAGNFTLCLYVDDTDAWRSEPESRRLVRLSSGDFHAMAYARRPGESQVLAALPAGRRVPRSVDRHVLHRRIERLRIARA